MLTNQIGKTKLTCKPENLMAYQLKLAKPPKGTAKRHAEKRVFPKTAHDLSSTANYVRAYYALNRFCYVAPDAYILNTAPTTWPEGPDCIVTEGED